MHGRTDNVKTVYPPQTKFAGGIKIIILASKLGDEPLLECIIRTNLLNYFEFGPVLQEEMSFRDISYLQL